MIKITAIFSGQFVFKRWNVVDYQDSDQEEGIIISFPLFFIRERRAAILRLRKLIEDNNFNWLIEKNGKWFLNLDDVNNSINELKGIEWLKGIIKVTLEFDKDIPTSKVNFTLTKAEIKQSRHKTKISSKGGNKYIDKKKVEPFEIKENIVREIKSIGDKPIPPGFEISIKTSKIPGTVIVKYKIPGNSKEFEAGPVQIKNATIYLPLTFVFLCYSKEDKSKIQKISDKLNNFGILTWYDEKNLLPGDDWEGKIEEAIKKSDFVLIFLSSNTTFKTGFKNREIEYALNQRSLKPTGQSYIIPVLLDDFQPPREFRKIQWLKVWEKNWFDKLLKTISPINYFQPNPGFNTEQKTDGS